MAVCVPVTGALSQPGVIDCNTCTVCHSTAACPLSPPAGWLAGVPCVNIIYLLHSRLIYRACRYNVYDDDEVILMWLHPDGVVILPAFRRLQHRKTRARRTPVQAVMCVSQTLLSAS